MTRRASVDLPFRRSRPVVGMVHLAPLPGAPGYQGDMARVLERAAADADVLAAAGMDGILVENFGDVPFYPGPVRPETVAALACAVTRVRAVAGTLPVGVNVLRNDPRGALAVAAATGAAFIRVNVHAGTMWTDQGPIVGSAPDTIRARDVLAPACAVLADVHVKHAVPPAGEDLCEAASNTWHRALADALVVSGSGTGSPTDPDRLQRVARAVPEAPVWVGSGVSPDTLADLWPNADGFIVGSWIEEGGQAGAPVDPSRARQLVAAADALRAGEGGSTERNGER